MKRQLGPVLIVLALLAAPAAWSQSSSGSSTDPSQNGATDSSQSGSTDSTQNSSSSSSSTSSGSTSSNPTDSSSSPTGFTPTGPDSSQAGAGDSSPQATTGPQATFTHPEQLPALSTLNEVTANTGVTATVATGISADSNASGAPTTNWLGLASIYGTFGITQVRPHINWSLNYGGGTLQALGGQNYYNSVSQAGTAGVLWQLARRWQLVLHDSYIYTSDPFQPYLTINYLPTFNDPNPTIYIPQATSQMNTGTADLTYQLSAHDTIDVSGFENFLRYQASTLSLQNTFMWAGSAFYEHEISARLAVGGGYEFSALDFGHGESRAGVSTFEGFVSYKINPGMSFAAWVGPELTNTKDIVPEFCFPGYGCIYQVVHSSFFNVAEGANFTWSRSHSAFHAKFSHRVTNGGGLLGAVRLYMFSADYRQMLSSRWSLLGGVLYGKNNSISFIQGNEYLNSITAQIGFSRMLNPSWTANAFYAVIDQKQNNIPGYTNPQWLDNRIALSLQYSWGHSLGR
jgi:hypothetical protein